MYLLSLRIVADNFDLSVKSRVQTKNCGNQSIHWTHQDVIKDRVICNPTLELAPKCEIGNLPLHYLLPTVDVQKAFKSDCAVLVSRVITKYLKAFQQMTDVVVYHIPHPYVKEASSTSEQVCNIIQNYLTSLYIIYLDILVFYC